MKIDFKDMGKHKDNVCGYCRKIMKEKDYPKTLEIYRGDMLCLTVDVEKMSQFRLDKSSFNYYPYDEAEEARLNSLAKGTV